MGYLKVSSVPKSALQLYVKRGAPIEEQCMLRMCRKPILSFKMEEDLVDYRLEMDRRYYGLREPEMEKINFNPLRTYNVDETGITTVQSKIAKVITLKGKTTSGSPKSCGKWSTITCMNAASRFIPPLFAFRRKNVKAELLDGASPGSVADCHPSGWIQSHIFTRWFQYFINHLRPSKEDPALLTLGVHYSQTRNLDFAYYIT
nr:unnamed protein product [Callosobruchus analis]